MAPAKCERVYRVGDRVRFCGWPGTVSCANEPHPYWPRWEYHVTMDPAGCCSRTTAIERTAIGVGAEELEPLEEGTHG